MTEIVDEAIRRYYGRMPNAREAKMQDPQYSMQMHWIRHMLAVVDMAMQDEGVEPIARQRVIRTVLYGTPDPDLAMERVEQNKKLIEKISSSSWPPPPPWKVDGSSA